MYTYSLNIRLIHYNAFWNVILQSWFGFFIFLLLFFSLLHNSINSAVLFPGESPRGEWEEMSSSALFLNAQNSCHCHHTEVPQPLSQMQTLQCTIYKIYIEVMLCIIFALFMSKEQSIMLDSTLDCSNSPNKTSFSWRAKMLA